LRLRLKVSRNVGGYKFLADPDLAAPDNPVFWRPESCASVLILSPNPTETFGSVIRKSDLRKQLSREDAESRVHFLFVHQNFRAQIYISDQTRSSELLQAVIPLDQNTLHRMAATGEFFRAITGKPMSRQAKPKLNTLRLHRALQALDAMAANATQREIAELLYGQRRVKEEPWKTSSLRQSTIRLCRLGQKMVNGGYAKLLSE